jgi:hypothetical protein
MQGIGDQVDQQPVEQGGVGMHLQTGIAKAQDEALGRGAAREGRLQAGEAVGKRVDAQLRRDAGDVEARKVEEGIEQFAQGGGGCADFFRQLGQLGVVPRGDLVCEVGGEKGEGVQGLAQIVAGGGQKTALGKIGALGAVFLRHPVRFGLEQFLFERRLGGFQCAVFAFCGTPLAADEQLAGHEQRQAEQRRKAIGAGAFLPVDEQGAFRHQGEDAQVGKAVDIGDVDDLARMAFGNHFARQGCRRSAENAAVMRADQGRLLRKIGRPAGCDDASLGVDEQRFECRARTDGAAKILKIGWLQGGEHRAGKPPAGAAQAAGQGVGVAVGIAADVRAVHGEIGTVFERHEIGTVAHVDQAGGELGRNEALIALCIEEDQVAQLRQRPAVAAAQILEAARRAPARPLRRARQIAGQLAQQDVHCLQGARRVFGDQTGQLRGLLPAGGDFPGAFIGKIGKRRAEQDETCKPQEARQVAPETLRQTKRFHSGIR